MNVLLVFVDYNVGFYGQFYCSKMQCFVCDFVVDIVDFKYYVVRFYFVCLVIYGIFIFIYMNFDRFRGYRSVWEDVDLNMVLMFYVVGYSVVGCFDLMCSYMFRGGCFQVVGVEVQSGIIFGFVFDVVFLYFVEFSMFWLKY